MDAKLLNIFIDAALNVIETMAFTKATADKARLKQDRTTGGDVTGVIGLVSSELKGNMVLSFEASTILAIVNSMLGSSYKDINSDVADAVGELTNMICGASKRGLAEYKSISLDFAIPTTIVGKGMEINFQSNVPVIEIPFTTDFGKFVIDLTLGKSRI